MAQRYRHRRIAPAGFPKHRQRIGQAVGAHAAPINGALHSIAAACRAPRGRQQISAVHRRHVARRQRLQRTGVVPVEQMTLVALQRPRVAMVANSAAEIVGGQIAEIARRQRRGQPESDIGGRGSLRHLHVQRQLRIIRRQPVVFPAPPDRRKSARCAGRYGADRTLSALIQGSRRRPADGSATASTPAPPPRAARTGRSARTPLALRARSSMRTPARKSPASDASRREMTVRVGARSLRRLPFQQFAMADHHPVKGPDDGVHRKPRLMRQKRDHDDGAHQFDPRRPATAAPRPAGGAPADRAAARARESRSPAPPPGSTRPAPPKSASRTAAAAGRDRHQAAPQIIEDAPAIQHGQRIRPVPPEAEPVSIQRAICQSPRIQRCSRLLKLA